MHKITIFVAMLSALLLVTASAQAATRVTDDSIAKSAAWSGKVVVERPVKVEKGATLTVKPGAEVRFKKGASLNVEGTLKAAGTKAAAIVFTSDEPSPAAGDWQGINLIESGDGTVLRHCKVSYATAVGLSVCSPEISSCEIKNGVNGVSIARKSQAKIEGNTIRGMTELGVNCQMGSSPALTGNTIEDCVQAGIGVAQDSHPVIRNNVIARCGTGIGISKPVPPVEGNTLRDNRVGIYLSSVGEGQIIRGNKISGGETGIVCQQFSTPLIEKNDISAGKEAIVCFRAASPVIRNNNIHGSGKGLSCIQICRPRVVANNIHDNKTGIYLDLSSYALIRENNIYANEVHIELSNMSSDWERRTKHKPERGAQAQNATMAGRGKAVRTQVQDGAEIMGFVDAADNWWGDTTKEMEAKGPDADIKGFKDYYDVPKMRYEGYTGMYVQDRVVYEPWRKARNKAAGF